MTAGISLSTPGYWEEACKHLAKRDRVLRKLIPSLGDGRLESRGDAFTTLARSVVGQQISVKAAQSVWRRFAELMAGDGHVVLPNSVLALGVDAMRSAGLSGRKVEYISDLAQHFQSGKVHVAQWQGMGDEAIIEELVAVQRQRPLDGRNVFDVPLDAAERVAAGRCGLDQRHQRELLQRRASVACRSP